MINKEFIENLSYPDFVGFINQWNVLPGAYDTINRWAIFGHVNSSSKILQFACTTGFQSRELALLTGCSAVGVDISASSIEMARWNAEQYAPNANLNYINTDAINFESNEKFTHVAVGAGLKFFQKPELAMSQCLSLLKDGGYILASPFWIINPIPEKVLKAASSVFGIEPTCTGYDEVMNLYRGLDVVYEQHFDLRIEPEEEIEKYCDATINRTSVIRNITDPDVLLVMKNRLRDIRKMSNQLRSYQKYSVLVLRYREKNYPNRYVELF
ncbi:class I SAM-dependent methyltransferase [Acinetobacter sp. ACIN00229]|uniref:class I SAM-dependent methyltransferase n=1 Tax=Acinetobacter sp. ACIN00229 TaxID=2792607 RepID=UPI0018DFF8C8|nr:class I SAM-dependent methyltransferase [Acinetobacter sp. ACIN00229]MBI0421300.1 class I SAM-dependent methyltransferase [Acinetobacter sp. ACIN00229]